MTTQHDIEKISQSNVNIFKIEFLDANILRQSSRNIPVYFEVSNLGKEEIRNPNFFWEIINPKDVFNTAPFLNKEVVFLKNLATGKKKKS
jgi:hypothetical protein